MTPPYFAFFAIFTIQLVHSAIIPNENQAQRVYLGESSENHETIVASPNNRQINTRLCDQCKHSALCRLEGNCKHCSQYCTTYETDEETGRNFENSNENINLTSRHLITDFTDEEPRTSEAEPQYYPVAVVEPGVLLKTLMKFTGLRNLDGIERAAILMKSGKPLDLKSNPEKARSDLLFLRQLSFELDQAEKQTGKHPLNIYEVGEILENLYKNVEQNSENPENNAQNDTVGCSKEKTETQPFYPLQPLYNSHPAPEKSHSLILEPAESDEYSSYEEDDHMKRKNPGVIQSAPLIHNTRNNAAGKTQELLDTVSQKLKDLEQSTLMEKNPENSLEDTENEESRTHHKKHKKNKKHESYPPSSYGGGYRASETESETIKVPEINMEEDAEKIQHLEESEKILEDSDNEQSRTHHKKYKKKKNKKQESYPSQYGGGYRASEPEEVNLQQPSVMLNQNEESIPEDLDNEQSRTHHKKNKKQEGNYPSPSYGGGYRASESVILEPSLMMENPEDENEQSRTHHKKNKKQKGYPPSYGSNGYRTSEDDTIQIPETNIKLDRKMVENARPELDEHEGIPSEIHDGIHAHFRRIQDQLTTTQIPLNQREAKDEDLHMLPENTNKHRETEKLKTDQNSIPVEHVEEPTNSVNTVEETPMSVQNNEVGNPEMLPDDENPELNEDFSTIKPQSPVTIAARTSEIKNNEDHSETTDFSEIVGNKQQEISENDITVEKIEKLMTPQEQDFLQNFGKIVPAVDKMALSSNTDVFFMGNGIKLPLKVNQNTDGSIALSVDIEKLCKCKNATCVHTKEMVEQLNQELAGIPTSNDETDLKPAENLHEHSSQRKARKSKHHSHRSRHSRRYRSLQKRSLGNNGNDYGNIIIKDSSNNDSQEIQKFKHIEKELERKLQQLHEDVKKTNKQYDEMVQKSTQDLLQIKTEDQVVKHRIELVNDFINWMRKMAETMTNSGDKTNKNIVA